jgi:hypothetical protein
MGKDAPKPPKAAKVSAEQATYNKQAAQDTLNFSAPGATTSTPFGSSTVLRDADGNPIGTERNLSAGLQPTAGNLMSNMQAQTGLLPTEAFSSITAAPDTSAISQTFFDKGAALLQPQFAQAQNRWRVEEAERGLPIGSEASMDQRGNLDRQQSLAMSDLASQATLLAPQEQQRLIQNARADYLQPYDTARASTQNLGLLNSFLPQTNLAQPGVQSVNHSQNVQNEYQAKMDAYNSQMGGIGQLVSTGLGLLTAPMTGGASLLGAAGGLFGGGGGTISNVMGTSGAYAPGLPWGSY